MYSCACNHVISLLCFFNQSTITGWFGINSEWIVHIMVKCLSHNEMFCVGGFLEENATLLFCQLTGRSSPVTDSCMLDVRGRGAIAAVTMSVSQCRVTHFHTLLHPAFSCRGLVPTRWDITMLESGKGQSCRRLLIALSGCRQLCQFLLLQSSHRGRDMSRRCR